MGGRIAREKDENETSRKQCVSCLKSKKRTKDYYADYTFNSINADKKLAICKDCLWDIAGYTGDIPLAKKALKTINRPFLSNIWESSVNEASDEKSIFRTYMKNIQMKERKTLTWADSDNELPVMLDTPTEKTPEKSSFTINDRIIDKWGYGYTNDEYKLFERKYEKLINNYGEKTALHTEGLINYIRYRVKEEIATAKGDVKEAKEWGQLASKAATDAKINVSQLSKSDISGGVDVLSQMFEAVENEVSVIPLLPKIMEQPYDDADLIIWATVNYNRRLEDKVPASYRDIWNFYDEMLQEHFDSQGYSADQIKEFKAKRNNVFRDLEKVYVEPLYEGDVE